MERSQETWERERDAPKNPTKVVRISTTNSWGHSLIYISDPTVTATKIQTDQKTTETPWGYVRQMYILWISVAERIHERYILLATHAREHPHTIVYQSSGANEPVHSWDISATFFTCLSH